MSAVVECLLNLRDHLNSELGEDGFLDVGNIGGQFRKRWRLPEIDRSTALGVDQGDNTQDQQISNMFAEGRRKGQTESKLKSTSRSPAMSGARIDLLAASKNLIVVVSRLSCFIFIALVAITSFLFMHTPI